MTLSLSEFKRLCLLVAQEAAMLRGKYESIITCCHEAGIQLQYTRKSRLFHACASLKQKVIYLPTTFSAFAAEFYLAHEYFHLSYPETLQLPSVWQELLAHQFALSFLKLV